MRTEASWMGPRCYKEIPLPFYHMRIQETSKFWKEEGPHPAGALLLDFQPPEL